MSKVKKNESELNDHKLNKKQLEPPLIAYGMNLQTSSWFDDRLPDMLWAILIITNVDRDSALECFRHVAKFVQANKGYSDVTHSGISTLSTTKQKVFIKHLVDYSDEIKSHLKVLLLFPNLPSFKLWEDILGERDSAESDNWTKLADSVGKVFWHQSQEATDVRWVKVLCFILGGKVKFYQKMTETVKGILEYPNYGDMKQVRPSIRAMEITQKLQEDNISEWPKSFWDYCYKNTPCIPEEAVKKSIKVLQEKLGNEIELTRKHYHKETSDLRNKIIDHLFDSVGTTGIDSRHEGVFGLILYAMTLFIEIVFYSTSSSITGRLSLRALVEVLITIKYLLLKEKEEEDVWDDYRGYGTGQIKLIYLKLKELEDQPSSTHLHTMEMIANEDKWVEFTPINLGHWDSANLRRMSETVGLKELYDRNYSYTSGFMHGSWGAIRESVYQICVSPLHRYHRIPVFDLPLMPSVLEDAKEITNQILTSLSEAYPKFEDRLSDFSESKVEDDE